MAKEKEQGVTAGVLSAQEGWSFVRGLEEVSLNDYLALYNARIEAYRVEKKDYGTRVTVKLAFPLADNANNVNLWTFFIASAMHKLGKKPFIQVQPVEKGFVSYTSFTVYGSPKYMESKGGGSNQF